MLNTRYNVLDDGFIRLVDIMGDDASIVQAARVSYGDGTKKSSDDSELIKYLMRHKHTSPFEMCEIKLHVRVPMDCWRQWIRHRTANVNEYSTRYSIAINAAKKTEPSEWRLQAESNRQGSDGVIDAELGSHLSEREAGIHATCREVYEERIAAGVAREQARKDLPLSTYTEAYWKIDLHNLLHFLELRMNPHAQYEIRQYANIIGYEIVAKWVPITWKAFIDYRLNSVSFSETEIELLGLIYAQKHHEAVEAFREIGWLKKQDAGWKTTREADEFFAKLEKMAITYSWLEHS
jgi:thymidylate synthase (FAD)